MKLLKALETLPAGTIVVSKSFGVAMKIKEVEPGSKTLADKHGKTIHNHTVLVYARANDWTVTDNHLEMI